MLESARQVVLNEQIILDISARDKYEYRLHDLRYILESDDQQVVEILRYDDHTEIREIEIKYYDQHGHRIGHARKKDFKDISASGGSTMVTDSRYLVYTFTPRAFPIYIERTWIERGQNTAFLAEWGKWGGHKSVLKSSIELTAPPDLGLRITASNINLDRVATSSQGNRHYYEIVDLPASTIQHLESQGKEPHIRPSLTLFSLAGVAGHATSWAGLGKWYYESFLRGRQSLPDRIDELDALIGDCDTDACKIAGIYAYVQERTRYISIQEGIGGWLPMEANQVHQLGYGDCKGLTNYTMALLDRIGIKSYYTILYGGSERRHIDSEPVALSGNHVLLCVPQVDQKRDTIWIECTAKNNPLGHLGSFADDRQVLVISEDGAQICRTRKYGVDQNLKATSSRIRMDNGGHCQIRWREVWSGIYYDYNCAGGSAKKRRESIMHAFRNLPGLDIDESTCMLMPEHLVSVRSAHLTMPAMGRSVGEYKVLPAMPLSSLNGSAQRTWDRESRIVDSTVLVLPVNYHLVETPSNTQIKGPNWQFFKTCAIEREDTHLTITIVHELIMKNILKDRSKPERYVIDWKKIQSHLDESLLFTHN